MCENKSAEFYWEEMEKSIAIRGKYNKKRYKKQMLSVMRLEKMEIWKEITHELDATAILLNRLGNWRS